MTYLSIGAVLSVVSWALLYAGGYKIRYALFGAFLTFGCWPGVLLALVVAYLFYDIEGR